MRFFLIVLVMLALFATAWHAAFNGTDYANMKGAPQIEREIHRAALKIMADLGGDPVEIRTSGRQVVLTGHIDSKDRRDHLLDRIGAIRLVSGLSDEMTLLKRADPFTLKVEKSAEGGVSVEGFVPNRRAEDRLLAQAREISGREGVSAKLELASGAPDGNWPGMVSTGMQALGAMMSGTLEISGTEAKLSGVVEDAARKSEVDAAIAAAPMGTWSHDLIAARPADGYIFRASKPLDGAVLVDGNAPDAATAKTLMTAAATITGRTVEGALLTAKGMPGPKWPEQVNQGLEAGSIDLRDWALRIEGTVDTDDDRAKLTPLLGEDWEVAITVRNPTPPGNITLMLGMDGSLKVNGLLPEGLSPQAVAKVLPGADTTGLEPVLRGRRADWTGALDGLSIILPQFEELEVAIAATTITARGILKREFNARGVEAVLRNTVGPVWALRISVLERRPLAELTIVFVDDQIQFSGVVPVGISTEEVLAMAGPGARAMGLTGGGEGNTDDWKKVLTAVTGLIPTFDDMAVEVIEQRVAITGTLRPGYGPEDLQSRLSGQIGDDWDLEFSVNGITANEGDRRRDLTTGAQETYRNGHWLPDVSFTVSSAQCETQFKTALDTQRIDFAEEDFSIDAKYRALLNRLSAIAIRCLNSSALVLEVSGHTASVGNDDENRRVSAQRAAAVVAALAERGVRPGAMVAVGRGEDDPVASNNTAEGRAQNERIAFRWRDSEN